MKLIQSFQCEKCRTVYSTQQQAEACEAQPLYGGELAEVGEYVASTSGWGRHEAKDEARNWWVFRPKDMTSESHFDHLDTYRPIWRVVAKIMVPDRWSRNDLGQYYSENRVNAHKVWYLLYCPIPPWNKPALVRNSADHYGKLDKVSTPADEAFFPTPSFEARNIDSYPLL